MKMFVSIRTIIIPVITKLYLDILYKESLNEGRKILCCGIGEISEHLYNPIKSDCNNTGFPI